jgi:hypothetical protein
MLRVLCLIRVLVRPRLLHFCVLSYRSSVNSKQLEILFPSHLRARQNSHEAQMQFSHCRALTCLFDSRTTQCHHITQICSNLGSRNTFRMIKVFSDVIFCRCLNVSRSLERPKQLHVRGSGNPSSLDSKNHTLGHTSSRSLLWPTHNRQIVLRSSKINLAVLVGECLRVFRQEYLLDFSVCVCLCISCSAFGSSAKLSHGRGASCEVPSAALLNTIKASGMQRRVA